MSSNKNGLSDGKDEDAVEEEPKVGFTSGISGAGAGGDVGLNAAGPSEEARVSGENVVKAEEAMVAEASEDVLNESGVSESEENKYGDAYRASDNQASSSIPTDLQDVKPEKKRTSGMVADYDSLLSGFDEFVAKGKGESVGNGYEVGDMVWGKVKSHPWWPGFIYNEAFATPSVRRTKHEGHVLVAFFGDGSYGWFEPAELIPFEKNFAEKSRQTLSRSFLKAVEEAVDEVSRRRGLGLVCRCRNEFNLWPTSVEGYSVVDVAGYEQGAVYSTSQIEKARDSFRPREILAFVQQLALKPLADEYWMLDFIKNKATVFAYRKALFEEYDETYAQAFGTEFVRPTRPTKPPVINSSKDPLSGRLVIAEALGKEKSSAKSIRIKDQIEKERYLFKRRDSPNEFKAKKASLTQSGSSSQPLLEDGLHVSGKVDYTGMSEHVRQTPEPDIPTSHQVSVADFHKKKLQDICSGSKKLLDNGAKKAKVHKRPAGEISTENPVLAEKKKKKRKKEMGIRASTSHVQIPGAIDNVRAALERVSGTSAQVSLDEKSQLPSMETSQAAGIGNAEFELAVLLKDLQALALNPFHGVERRSPPIIRQVFSKFRSLVYQKSLALSAPAENESNEARESKFPAARAAASSADNIKEVSTVKPVKPPPDRHDVPGKVGKKRGPSDRLEEIAAKKKKRFDDVKSLAAEKKAARKNMDIPRGGVKEMGAKIVPPTPKKALKLESSKRIEQQPTRAADRAMLVMKFPPGGALPSIAELKAKFARFGPLDHSGTRVFWKSSTCRLVYQSKIHAQAALKFASGSSNLFGNTNVRCYLREMEVEGQESEPAKVQKDDSSAGASQQPKDYSAEQRLAAKLTLTPHQQLTAQLKSCLKKSSGDEGGSGGGGRSTRVKFVLGGDEMQLLSGNENTNDIATFPEAASTHSVGLSSKNFAKVISHSANPLTSNQFQNLRSNMPFSEQVSASFNAPPTPHIPIIPTTNNDIAQQMLNLLIKCNDVVTNLTGILGYVPYHPL
ncbi:Tudor/PWWP/MBT superfamily protein [Abeliophyllum distichum]|uniref:Tudor/PWWP/MBT superfamily protein n=1 Tax=Abeliophyllum distichum TaxID=126358 RepID=A0ABD1RU43_9LAMI